MADIYTYVQFICLGKSLNRKRDKSLNSKKKNNLVRYLTELIEFIWINKEVHSKSEIEKNSCLSNLLFN